MIPKSLSATSMTVASLCLARWKAEHLEYGRGIGNVAATIGTAVHGALEMYVKSCIQEQQFPATLDTLLMFFKMSYSATFNSSDYDTKEYTDGIDMLTRWIERTDFSKFEVISCEVKENFPIKTSVGDIPFNFIWDRFDRLDEDTVRVVDYKTNAWGLNPADLKKKVQARAYGVAAQIKFPDAKRIWVQFDMLRHEGPVGIAFSREDNIATFRFLQATAERIIAQPMVEVPETLNPECRFCVRKAQCETLRKNIAVGGIMSISSPEEAIDLRAVLEYQQSAIASVMKELDAMILAEAKEEDRFEYVSDRNVMEITVSSRRSVDAERVEQIIGPRLFEKYGGKTFTVASIDKLTKGTELTDEQKAQLKSVVWMKKGEPSVKVRPINPIDEE